MDNKKDTENEFGVTGIGLPGEILFNPFITPMQKILFGFLRSLSKTSRGCWASNVNIAKYIGGCHKNSVGAMIAQLEKFKYIEIKNVLIKDNVYERRIYENIEYYKIYKPLVCCFNENKKNDNLQNELKISVLEIILKNKMNVSWMDIGIRRFFSENEDNLSYKKKKQKYHQEVKKLLDDIFTPLNDSIDPPSMIALTPLNAIIDAISYIDRYIDNYKDTSFNKLKETNDDEKSSFSTQNFKSKRTAPKRNDNPQLNTEKIIPQKKKDPINKINHMSGWKELLLKDWNKIPQTTTHKDTSTNLLRSASKNIDYLLNGTFFKYNKINKDFFLKKNKLSIEQIENYKFTERNILKAVKDYELYFKEGYWPIKKKSLPKNLKDFICNENYKTKECTSFLFKILIEGTPKSFKEEKKNSDFNPQYTKYFRDKGLLKNFSEEEMPDVFRGISAIETRVIKDKIFDFDKNILKLKQVIGEPGKLEPMFENYAKFLKEYNRLDKDKIFYPYGYFNEFLEELQNTYSSFKVYI